MIGWVIAAVVVGHLHQYAKPLNIRVACSCHCREDLGKHHYLLLLYLPPNNLLLGLFTAIGQGITTTPWFATRVRFYSLPVLLAPLSSFFLSGIGPRPYLSSWGIPVVHHCPYVGQYLYDNPRNGISIVPPMPLEHSLIQVVGITNFGAYLEAASNVIPFSSPARFVFIRTPASPLHLTVATLMEKILGPLSTGSLRLASTKVRTSPIVRFNYFSNPEDVEKCVNGTRKIGAILRSRSMADFRFQEWYGGRSFRFVGPALPHDQ